MTKTKTKTKTIRASEADIVLHCGLAARPPDHPIDITGPEALIGLAAHDALEPWAAGGFVGEPEPQPAANKHGVDADTIAALIATAPAAIAQIREDLSAPQAEIKIEDDLIRGRMDVVNLSMADGKLFGAAVLDWKTGRDPLAGGKPAQRMAYASAIEAKHGMPAQGYIYTAEIWLGSGDIIESRYDLDTITGFRARLRDRMAHPSASPGAHCRYCRRRHECQERDIYIRSAATSLTKIGAGKVITADDIGALWDQSRALKQALEHYEKIVDTLVEDNGSLELGDGRKIIHITQTRDNIDARKAWPVMRAAGLNDDAINAALRISKTALLDAVGKCAARGEKGKAKAAMTTALDEAGAIARTTIRKRKVV
jgi:hypothetical protein